MHTYTRVCVRNGKVLLWMRGGLKRVNTRSTHILVFIHVYSLYFIHVYSLYFIHVYSLYGIRACIRKGPVLLWMRGERNECIHVARIYMWTYLYNTRVCERNGKLLLWMRGGLNECIHVVRKYVYSYKCTYLYNTRKQTSRSLHRTCSRSSGMRPSSAPSSRTDVIMSGVMGCVCMYACIDVLVHESYIQTGNRYTHIYNWIQTNWHVYPTNTCGQHVKLDILLSCCQ